MDPTTNATPPADTSQAAPAPQPAAAGAPASVPAISEEQIQARIAAAVQQAQNATWKQARETFEKKASTSQPTAPQPPASQPAAAPSAAVMTPQDFVRLSAFTAAATEHGIPPKGVEMLLGEFVTAKPDDARAWVAQQAEAYGWRKTTPTTTTPTAPIAPVTIAPQNATPVTGNAAPTSPVTVTVDTPMLSRSEADRVAYLGGDLARPNLDRVVEMTNRLMAEARAGARLKFRR